MTEKSGRFLEKLLEIIYPPKSIQDCELTIKVLTELSIKNYLFQFNLLEKLKF
jgi:hypothetical protein